MLHLQFSVALCDAKWGGKEWITKLWDQSQWIRRLMGILVKIDNINFSPIPAHGLLSPSVHLCVPAAPNLMLPECYRFRHSSDDLHSSTEVIVSYSLLIKNVIWCRFSPSVTQWEVLTKPQVFIYSWEQLFLQEVISSWSYLIFDIDINEAHLY